MNRFRVFILVFLVLVSCSFSFSKFQEFSQYDTKIIFNDDSTITISNTIYLRNTHSVGIVPGEFEFELYTHDDSFEIIDFNVKNSNGDDITTRLIETQNKTSLVMNLFTPILPGFESVVNIDYTFKYSTSGFLFKRMEVPIIQDTALPIKSGNYSIELEDNKRFTYISYYKNNSNLSKNSLHFEIDETTPSNLLIEYSRIPLKIGNYPGSLVFWLTINILLIVLLGFQLKNEFKKVREDYF